MNNLRAQSSPFTGRSSEAPAPYSPLAFHRSISLRSAARPAASTFAHCERVKRNVRCTSSLSGGTGGRPGFLGSSMLQLSVAREQLASVAFSCHNNAMQTVVKTLKIRVKDKHASVLCRMARDVNTTRNLQ